VYLRQPEITPYALSNDPLYGSRFISGRRRQHRNAHQMGVQALSAKAASKFESL
jgi:hypothetical protein